MLSRIWGYCLASAGLFACVTAVYAGETALTASSGTTAGSIVEPRDPPVVHHLNPAAPYGVMYTRVPGGPLVKAPPNAAATLPYNGGPVVSNIQVVEVLWGAGSFVTGVSNTAAPSMASFFQGILSSPYVDWLSEYNTVGVTAAGGATTNQTIGRGTFLGQYTITPSGANGTTTLTQANIQAELASQIEAHNLPAPTFDAAGNPNTYYALFFPAGTLLYLGTESSCASVTPAGSFCAYHSSASTTLGTALFGVHPNATEPGPSCANTVAIGCGATGATAFEATAQIASHELFETITDPVGGTGWLSSTYDEIGDMCNDQPGIVIGSDGLTYVVQQQFSNVQHACVTAGPSGVAMGGAHTCALTPSGGVQCWGSNTYGQLGNGSTSDSSVPVPVTGLSSGVVAISAGNNFSCALTTSGQVQCWGYNNIGQLGNGTLVNATTPVAVSGLSNVIAITSGNGGGHSCALTTAGAVYCWGNNQFGQLGNGTTTNSALPVQVNGLTSGVVTIVAGAEHSCAVGVASSSTGVQAVACWGNNTFGQLGDGTTTNSSIPVRVSSAVGGLQGPGAIVAAGGGHTCGLSSETTFCWGDNSSGQLGNNSLTNSTTAVAVAGLTAGRVFTEALGDQHSCLLGIGGALLCWGNNAFSQLGNGGTTNSPTVVQATGLAGTPIQVFAGTGRTCAQIGSGAQELQCWGDNANGQLGNGTTSATPVTTPVSVSGLTVYPPPQTQSITFPTIANQALAKGGFTPSVSASSGLTIVLGTVTPTVCEVGSLNVTFLANGTCTLEARQPGNSTYAPAAPVRRSFVIATSVASGAQGFLRPRTDFDGDGYSDLLWTNTNGSVALWLMNGGTPVASTSFGPYPGWSLFSGDADFNGDGKSDLVWTNSNGAVALWLMNGMTTSSSISFGPFAGWTLLSANGDFNGDGNSDLLWWNAGTGQAAIWLMSGTTMIGSGSYGPFPGWTVVSGNNDFNGDGKSDLLWTNTSGAATIWLMNGTTSTAGATFGPYAGWTVLAGDADYNGDGNTDLLWANTSGAATVWLMNGTNVTGSAAYGPFSGWTVESGNRDFDGDGKSDMLWVNSNGTATVWLMNGTTVTSAATIGPGAGWSALNACGDYNADGKTDLLWSNTNGSAATWLMNGTAAVTQTNLGAFSGWTINTARTAP